jgi:hypothetical protein
VSSHGSDHGCGSQYAATGTLPTFDIVGRCNGHGDSETRFSLTYPAGPSAAPAAAAGPAAGAAGAAAGAAGAAAARRLRAARAAHEPRATIDY